jgi:hypothetical protein
MKSPGAGVSEIALNWRSTYKPIINQRRISWLTSMITKTVKINGGKRPGAGRPKGSANRDRADQLKIARELLEEDLTPLAIMTARMLHRPLSNGTMVTDDQFAAACALAPYIHPKLTAMAVRDMTPGARAAQIEDSTPSIRLLLQQALGGVSKVVTGVAEEAEFFPPNGQG